MSAQDARRNEVRWYVARTKPRQEATAIEHLTRQNFAVYFPQISIERMRRDRISIEHEAFFPGYVLVQFVLADATWRVINSTRGVAKLLVFGQDGAPTPMPPGVVEQLQVREKRGQLFKSEIKRVRRGDQVRLKIGPAASQIGRVIFTRGERIELLLNLLGRQTRIKAPLHVVEIVEQRPIR